jgi:type II secretory pathway pseudopilin PulG
MVVIGIVLVLIGIAIVGLAQVQKHSKEQHTRVVLSAINSMMAEFTTAGGRQNAGSFASSWDDLQAVGSALVSQPIAPDATGNIQLWQPNPPGPPVASTWLWQDYSDQVLAVLLRVPSNKAILDKLPPEQITKVVSPSTNQLVYEILDGYGRPIRFIPSGGLLNVTTTSRTSGTFLLQSDGVLHDPTPGSKDRAPAPKYFWISAGADGDYLAADDNRYSTTAE